MAWIVVLLCVSGYLYTNSGGDFVKETVPTVSSVTTIRNGTKVVKAVNGTGITTLFVPCQLYSPPPSRHPHLRPVSATPYKNWDSVCNSSPYEYLRPFQFTYVGPNGASHAANPTYCAYPQANGIFRIIIGVFSLLTIFALFFKTPLSFFARQVWIVYALLYYAAFVLDCNASANGYLSCTNGFGDTNLADAIKAGGFKITCDSSKYPGMAILDLIVVAHFFLIYTAWALTPDLYVKKNQPPPPQQQYQPQPQQQFAPQPQYAPQPQQYAPQPQQFAPPPQQYAPAPQQYAPAPQQYAPSAPPAAAPPRSWSPFAKGAPSAPAATGSTLFGSKPAGAAPKTILGTL